MRDYLWNLKKYINFGKEEFFQECGYEDLSTLNEIPEKWWKEGFLIENHSLSEFFINLLYKMEYRETLHGTLLFHQKQIIIDLARLFDPFSFFVSTLIDFSMKNQVIYNEKFICIF